MKNNNNLAMKLLGYILMITLVFWSCDGAVKLEENITMESENCTWHDVYYQSSECTPSELGFDEDFNGLDAKHETSDPPSSFSSTTRSDVIRFKSSQIPARSTSIFFFDRLPNIPTRKRKKSYRKLDRYRP